MKNQKNKTKLAIYTILFVISLLGLVSAGESCYTKITVNETLVINSTDIIGINNAFGGQENLYGDYSWNVQEYNNETPSNYLLKTYDFSNNFLNAYSVRTGLLVYYDNFGNETDPGGVELLNESQTSTIIPYNSSIYRITIEFSDAGEQNLDGFDPSLLSCERTCLITGEEGIYENDSCCQGYTEISSDGTSLSCIKTNDGICDSDSGENKYNSFKDCFNISSYSCKEGFVKNMFGGCTALADAICGNGLIEPVQGELCDDKNNLSNDGCSSSCKLESTGFCSKQLGFVLFNNNSYQNTCDADKLIAYSCRFNLFTFNILKMFKYSLNQNIQTCEFSCLADRCLTQEEFNQINGTNPPLPPSGLDLPPEPEKPEPL